ncbi:peptide/nickel transport system substrate-binding protein [Loktanella atrilutea]|uniref:Peptide/nickel transport system substrate-binding protein n=1 Tax=Loktanella atrilutea TaxID=366533 RepID=A0A1M4U4L4_LOKAT|nr:ABC transporter substrate-binding protein [Loktanella atrilutea]SHE51672.1 peptide/nickel transport system substrate-binding protein [Loktanella atrilutea]
MTRLSLIATTAAVLLSTTSLVQAQERGGVMTYGRYADSMFLDPVLNDANVDIWILSNMYDTLLLPTDDGQSVQAGLATDWNVSDDGLTVTLTMRDGIMFSDGTPITTEDVIWSLDRARNPDNGIWNFLLAAVSEVTAPDDKTIEIKLAQPDPAILPALSVFNAAIMPKAAFEAMPGETDLEKATAFAEKPVGSGPFVFDSWERGSTLKLVKNEHYWADGADGQKLPYLDGVTFEVIPDDATRILRVQSGELDGAELIPFARVKELQDDPNINMELFPSTRVADIIINVRPELDGEPNPLSDVKVRQAMNYAANKDAIIQVVTFGVGTPTSSFMSSTTPLHTGDGPVFPYDLEKAKQLMSESGYPDGFTASILTLAGNQDELGIATALQQMWSQIGITLEIQQVDNATRTEQYRNGTFDMRAGAWTNDIADPNQITSYFAYSPTIDALHSGWKSEEVDKLFEESQSELDTDKRAEQYARIQEVFNQEGPTVLLYETPYPVALQDNVKGFNQIPLGNNIFRETYLEKE